MLVVMQHAHASFKRLKLQPIVFHQETSNGGVKETIQFLKQ